MSEQPTHDPVEHARHVAGHAWEAAYVLSRDPSHCLDAALTAFYGALRDAGLTRETPPEPTVDDAADYLLALTISDPLAVVRYHGEGRAALLTEPGAVEHIAEIARRRHPGDPALGQAVNGARDRLLAHIYAADRA